MSVSPYKSDLAAVAGKPQELFHVLLRHILSTSPRISLGAWSFSLTLASPGAKTLYESIRSYRNGMR